jgi:DNA-binding MarR family transcriptional regulator
VPVVDERSPDAVDEVRWLDDDEQRAWRAVLAGTTKLIEALDRDLRAHHHLSLADYEILVHLSEAPGRRLRMAELADAALLSRSRLTHRIDRLRDQGLVTREPCEEDKRGWFAVLTDHGFARLEEAVPTHVAGVRAYLVDPVDRAGLLAAGTALGAVAATVDATPG